MAVGRGDLVGAHRGQILEGRLAPLGHVRIHDGGELRVPGGQTVDGEADRADQVGTVDVALHRVEVGRRGRGVGCGDLQIGGVVRGLLDGRGRCAAALRMTVEGDFAVAAGEVACGAGAVEHGVGLLGAVHVRVHARGAHADVVGDEDADARTGEDPVVEALEVDQTSRREGICLVFQGPVARGCALVALADGAAADDDRRPLARAGPRHGRFDHVTADRDRISVHVDGGIQHLGHRGRERVVQLRRHGRGGCGGGAQNGSRGAGGDGRGVVEGLVDGGGIVGGAQRTERTGCVTAFGTAIATGTGTRAVTCIGGRQSRETGDGGQLGDVRGGGRRSRRAPDQDGAGKERGGGAAPESCRGSHVPDYFQT